jgi:hypothetical protein
MGWFSLPINCNYKAAESHAFGKKYVTGFKGDVDCKSSCQRNTIPFPVQRNPRPCTTAPMAAPLHSHPPLRTFTVTVLQIALPRGCNCSPFSPLCNNWAGFQAHLLLRPIALHCTSHVPLPSEEFMQRLHTEHHSASSQNPHSSSSFFLHSANDAALLKN